MGNSHSSDGSHDQVTVAQAQIITHQSAVVERLDKFGLIAVCVFGAIAVLFTTYIMITCRTSLKEWFRKQVDRNVERSIQKRAPQVVLE